MNKKLFRVFCSILRNLKYSSLRNLQDEGTKPRMSSCTHLILFRIRGSYLTKWPSETLQTLPYFWNTKSHILLCVALHFVLAYFRNFSLSTNLLFLLSVEFNVCIKGASNQKSKYVEYFAAAVVGNDKGDSLLFATRLALLHFYAWTISFSYCPLQIMPPFKLMSIGIFAR